MDAYSNTFYQVVALVDRFLVPVNRTSDDPDLNVHHAWNGRIRIVEQANRGR